jgi:CubicO group peptidase (beta-lactamase class C family)
MRRVYSNVGMELLAERVEAAVAMPFGTYLREAIVLPLNLAATTLQGSAAKDARSSVADMARIVFQLLRPNGLLDDQTIANATTVQYPGLRGVLPGYGSQDPNDWGLGFEIRSNKHPHWTGSRNSSETYGHFGQSGTMFWIDPVARLGLVALADEPFGPWAVAAWPTLSDAVLAAAQEP